MIGFALLLGSQANAQQTATKMGSSLPQKADTLESVWEEQAYSRAKETVL